MAVHRLALVLSGRSMGLVTKSANDSRRRGRLDLDHGSGSAEPHSKGMQRAI